jgi:hypothetical protein
MRVFLKFFLVLVLGLTIGLSAGFYTGQNSGYSIRDYEQQAKTYDDLLIEVSQREQVNLIDLVEADYSINKIDEGGLFNTKFVRYVRGTITNNAVATAIKDVRLEVRYISSTGSLISTQDVVLYEVILPRSSIEIREKISPPDKTDTYTVRIVGVSPTQDILL